MHPCLLQAGNINSTQQEVITKHLRYHLGKEFLPTKNGIAMLREGHAKVFCGHVMYKYKDIRAEEKVAFSIKAMHEEISIQLARLLESRKITPQEVRSIVVVLCGNHGDVSFQFRATVHVETETKRFHLKCPFLRCYTGLTLPTSWRRQYCRGS